MISSRVPALALTLLVGVSAPAIVLAAQARPAPGAQAESPAAAAAPEENARDTRERLRVLLDEYPPSVGQVLRLDPSLLHRPDYLATYPKLAAFFAQHPEVVHNPAFFLGDTGYLIADRRSGVLNVVKGVLAGMAGLIVFSTVVGLVVWVIRSVINYRSWLRATKIQTDAHTKIFDRLSSNEELLAYVQSPAGQRFLTSTSMTVDVLPRSIGAPVARILWSMQAGVVVALAGVGLWVAKGSVVEEVAQLLHVIAVLAMAIGVGFIVSAVLAYALSHRLGLFDPSARTSHA
jgi:hypothetical protein